MKKTNTPKRASSQNKTTAKKPASKTNKTKTVKKPRKNVKGRHSAVKALGLVAALVILTFIISSAIIFVYGRPPIDYDTGETLPIAPQPEISIPIQEEPIAPPIRVEPQVIVPAPPPPPAPPPAPPPVIAARPVIPTPPDPQPAALTPAAVIRPPPVENRGTLVFVIDDAGNNLRELEPFLRIQEPLTIAVLPGLAYSAEAARRIRAAGHEVILHQPMEAIGGQDPGPSAIFLGMSAEEIREILKRNLEEVGPVRGMNNHQGSRVTMDREAMRTILSFAKENGLYFLDSRTTANSVVPEVARKMGINIAQRNVFLDNEQDRNYMLRRLTGGTEIAQRSGLAVMIGHTWSPELAPLLEEQFQILTEKGFTIKTAGEIIGN